MVFLVAYLGLVFLKNPFLSEPLGLNQSQCQAEAMPKHLRLIGDQSVMISKQ